MMKLTIANGELTDCLAGEILTLNLVGKLVYQYPDREWYCNLIVDRIFDEIPLSAGQPDIQTGLARLQSWTDKCLEREAEEWFQEVESDYTRLFIGPGKVLAPPWESVFTKDGRMIFTETTLEVRHWYRRFGLEPENLHKEPDDHIALEMAFISHLATLMLQALEMGDMEQGEAILQAQRQFARTHFLKWAPLWCEQVLQHASTDFYRGVALLTRGAAAELAQVLDMDLVELIQ